MKAHEIVRQAREDQNLTADEVARDCGLSVAAYRDIEQHADELFTAVPLSVVKRLCVVLHLRLAALTGISSSLQCATQVPRNLLLKTRREAEGLSVAQLADMIGFEEHAVNLAEQDDLYLETLPLCVLLDWADKVRVPAWHLICDVSEGDENEPLA